MSISPMPLPPEPTPEQLFLAHLAHIERVATHACHRLRFGREETQDFVSSVNTKIIEDDYAVIRKHKGKSTLPTYLTVVVNHLFQDHLNHLWGKWRPSAEAVRLGPLAVQLDRMLHRDRLTLAETCEILLTNHHVAMSRQELEDLADKLPQRSSRQPPEGEESLDERPAEALTPDQEVLAQEAEARRRQVLGFLKEALKHLSSEDALIARMSSEHKISQIARTLRMDQKPLYRRRETILKTLRQELESHGVRAEEIPGLLSVPEGDHEPRD